MAAVGLELVAYLIAGWISGIFALSVRVPDLMEGSEYSMFLFSLRLRIDGLYLNAKIIKMQKKKKNQ